MPPCVPVWIKDTSLQIKDLVVWSKGRIGMGYRTRRACEFLLILQVPPYKVKGVWNVHNFQDLYYERIASLSKHPHRKPVALQRDLIKCIAMEDTVLVDPAAGSFSSLVSAYQAGVSFLGCDSVTGKVAL